MMTQNPQDWLAGFSGGILIGIASALLLLVNGRIAGISGIVGKILPPGSWSGFTSTKFASVAFVIGMLVAPIVWQLNAPLPTVVITTDILFLLVGGLLVGFGVAMANGCTSGHGVCGLSRGSLRSLVSVMVFMVTAAVVVAVMRHLVGGLL
jgi:uncharacterized membrane protein YedE/YeeE